MQNVGHQARPSSVPSDNCVSKETGASSELGDEDQKLHSRHDKIEIPPVKPIVTRVERYAGHCPCCHGVTLAPVPEGMEEGSPFSPNILALALYLRLSMPSAIND
jgi:transposase